MRTINSVGPDYFNVKIQCVDDYKKNGMGVLKTSLRSVYDDIPKDLMEERIFGKTIFGGKYTVVVATSLDLINMVVNNQIDFGSLKNMMKNENIIRSTSWRQETKTLTKCKQVIH